MIRRIIVYGFPFVFVLAEYVLRLLQHSEPGAFMGPTLASVGIGQLLPLVTLKDRTFMMSKSQRKDLAGYTLVTKADETVVQMAWMFILLFTLLWVVLLYVSFQRPPDANDVLFGHGTFYYGLATYFIAVILSEVKDWV
jgi:hypothetical protein